MLKNTEDQMDAPEPGEKAYMMTWWDDAWIAEAIVRESVGPDHVF